MKIEKIKVSGMTCGGCEAHIEKDLKTLEGIEHVKASHNDNSIFVKYDETKCNSETLKNAINNAGYQA